jgi:hypothetical protein
MSRYSGQALVDKYAADAATAVAMFAKAKMPVYCVSTPLSESQSLLYTNLTPLDVMFSQLPARFPVGNEVRYIDGATPLQWHGKFSFTLPCLPWEVCTGRWPDGTKTVVVRQADGTRAQRFALAISGPVSRDFRL